MKYTQYGTIIDSDIPHEAPGGGTEAFMPLERAVLLREKAVMPSVIKMETLAQENPEVPIVAFTMGGPVNSVDEYLSVAYIAQWEDIGVLIRQFMDAATRAPDPRCKEMLDMGFAFPERFSHEQNSNDQSND